ncbi:MAG: protein kinase [Deltaproteobacteria bacterium]|nr:protein kinase [Deltaproteobacteria bacterium]
MTDRRRPGATTPPIRDTLPLGSAARAAVTAGPDLGTAPTMTPANLLGTAPTMAVSSGVLGTAPTMTPADLLGTAPTMAVSSGVLGAAPTMTPANLLGTAPTMAVSSGVLGTAPAMTPANLLGTAPTMAVSSGVLGTPAEPIAAAGGTLDLPAADRVDAAATFAPGQMIGRFVVRALLGEGGMGVVVAGHDADLGRPVAIKLVKRELDHPAYRQRLLREAQAMARLEHPNVARVYEVGSERGRLFVAMELIDGVTLSMWLRVQRRPWREIAAMFEQVGAGLAAVHRAGLVHRDFKPDNVLVDRDGRARVVDFGLARLDGAASSAGSPELALSLTRTGVMMGTPGYMAPEQQFGGTVDARADQYSFCVALREALLGGRPTDPPDTAWGGTSRAVREIIARGLAYEPHDRFASMDELLAALRTATAARGGRRLAIAAAAAGVVVAGAVVAVIALRDPATPAPPPASPAGSPVVTPIPPAVHDQVRETHDLVNAAIREEVAKRADPLEAAAKRADPLEAAAKRADPSEAAASPKSNVAAAPPAPAAPKTSPAKGPPVATVAAERAGSATAPPPAQPSATQTGPAQPNPLAQRAPRLPAAYTSDPGHLPLVRATIADLGWDGFDPRADASAASSLAGTELGILNVKLGMLHRKKGRCDLAQRLLHEATQQLPPHDGDGAVWRARAHTTLAICALATGAPAGDHVNAAWVHGYRDHLQLLQALAFFERGETTVAQGLFHVAFGSGDPAVQAAIQTWLRGTGLTLP